MDKTIKKRSLEGLNNILINKILGKYHKNHGHQIQHSRQYNLNKV